GRVVPTGELLDLGRALAGEQSRLLMGGEPSGDGTEPIDMGRGQRSVRERVEPAVELAHRAGGLDLAACDALACTRGRRSKVLEAPHPGRAPLAGRLLRREKRSLGSTRAPP